MIRRHTREVPGNDLSHDADRLMSSVRKLVLVRLDHLSVYLVRPPGIVIDGLDREIHVDVLRPRECFAVVERLERSQFVRVCHHQVRQFIEELAALRSGNFETPRVIVSTLGGRDSAVDVLGRTLGDGGDHLSAR